MLVSYFGGAIAKAGEMVHAYRGGIKYPLEIWVVGKGPLDHLDSIGDISLG